MTHRLHLIVSDIKLQPNRDSYDLLVESATKSGLEVITHESSKIDFTSIPVLRAGDLLYRKSSDYISARLETLIINSNVASFYTGNPSAVRGRAPWSSAIALYKEGLQVVPSVYHLELNNKALLTKAIDSLGGFPIIVKSSAEAHGNGVFRFESIESLWAERLKLMELATTGRAALRTFIPHKYHARLIVLGGKIVDSIEYIAPNDDFRTNHSDKPNVQPRQFPKKLEEMSLQAVKVLDLEFGGVDIIVDENTNESYIAEVNFPCNFARSQLITGVAVSDLMIDFLLDKSRKMIAL